MTPAQFLQLADPLPEPTLLLTGDGSILGANRAAKNRLGLHPDTVRGRRLDEVVADPPEEVARYLRLCARSADMVLGGLTLMGTGERAVACRAEGAVLCARGEGTHPLLLLRLTPKETSGNQFIALNQKIEELTREIQRRRLAEDLIRRQEQRLRVTLASIGDGVIATDSEGRITSLNAAACTLTGWSSEEAVGRLLTEVFPILHEETRRPVENPVSQVIRHGAVVGLANHTLLLTRDGTERPIDDSAAPIKDDQGNVQGVVLVFRDATEQRRVERLQKDLQAELERQVRAQTAELRASEERFRLLVDGTTDYAIFLLDPQGRVASWNPGAERLKGYRAEEIIGQHFSRFYPQEAVERGWPEHELRVASKEGRFEDEGWRLRKDGTRFWANVVITALKDQEGNLRGFSKITRDLTHRKQAEEDARRLAAEQAARAAAEADAATIRAQREQLRITLESIGDAVIATDAQANITFLNPIAQALTGWTAQEAIGQPLGRVLDMRHERSGQRVDNPVDLALRGGRVVEVANQTVLISRDGTGRPIEDSAAPIKDEGGLVRGCILVFHDVADKRRHAEALRESEEKFRLLAEGLRQQVERLRLLNETAAHLLVADNPDAMARGLFERVKDHLGVDTYFNFMVNEGGDALHLESCAGIPEQEAAKITRLEFGQAICGTVALQRRAMVATHIQQSNDPKAQLIKAFGIRSYACNPLLSGDRLLGTLSFASHTRDQFNDGELEFIRTLSHYATAAYERLRLVNELREADRRKDEFLAMLAHELRNPLAPIRNALQILRTRNIDAVAAGRARDMMERQLRHLIRLVDDLLDVSRIMRNKIELRHETVDLRQVVERATEIAEPIIDAQGHELSVCVPTEPVLAEGDSVRLAQVVGNLLSNAAKYTERAGRIGLTLERQRDEVVLSVKDNGVGIPPELLRRVFDLFVQADRSMARSQGGLGIGLTLVKRLVEMHGGTVMAFSAGPGRGSEFVVRLPLARALGAQRASAAEENRAVRTRRRRVVVVDDNVDAAESSAMVLRLMGHEVRTAYDGPSGIAAVREFQPDVVLLDIGLPGMEGYEVARRMRLMPEGKAVRLVAVSGYGQEDDRRRSQDAGFDHHLVKPVDHTALENLLTGIAHPASKEAANRE